MRKVKTCIAAFIAILLILGSCAFYVNIKYKKQYKLFEGNATNGYSSFFANEIVKLPFKIQEKSKFSLKIGGSCVLGNINVTIIDSRGNVIYNQNGNNITLDIGQELTKGEYELSIKFDKAVLTSMVQSFSWDKDKPTAVSYPISIDESKFIKVTPLSSDKFKWPYYLYVPKKVKTNHLLVVPNNSGFTSDQNIFHEIQIQALMCSEINFADKLGAPLLIPVFPRWEKTVNIYTHALDRDSLITDIREIQRLDNQLISMIDHARSKLNDKNIKIDEKVFMKGFSASGMFTNRFSILHPERIQAAAIGSPGGWPILPISEYNNKKLRYPIGIADVNELAGFKVNMEKFKNLPLYFFIGENDSNDSVIYTDSYDEEDKVLIFDLFGKTPVERWGMAEKIYKSVGCNSQFALYPNIAHIETDEMNSDILKFFLKNN